MFKLAELFVQISANPAPMEAVLSSLKTKAAASGAAIGASMSNAFTSGAGVIGLAVRAAEGLFNLVEDGNEDVQQLGAYWGEAMLPIKAAVEGVVHTFTDWTTGIVESVKANEALREGISSAFENVKIAIDSGVEAFFSLKAAAEETFTGAVILVRQMGDSIMSTFGGSALTAVTDWGAAIKTWVVDKIELAGIFVRNWPDFFEIAKISIQQKITNIGEYIGMIPANLRLIADYVATNWRALMVDAISAVGTAFQNLGENLGSLTSSLKEWAKNPMKGFHFEWKPLLDGFKATADELPALLRPVLTDMSDQIKAVQDRIAAREAAGFTPHKTVAKAAAAQEAAAAMADGGKFKSSIESAADYRSKTIMGIFSDRDDTPKKQLQVQERIAKATEETNKKLDKPGLARLG